jgi:hypothetical protein
MLNIIKNNNWKKNNLRKKVQNVFSKEKTVLWIYWNKLWIKNNDNIVQEIWINQFLQRAVNFKIQFWKIIKIMKSQILKYKREKMSWKDKAQCYLQVLNCQW